MEAGSEEETMEEDLSLGLSLMAHSAQGHLPGSGTTYSSPVSYIINQNNAPIDLPTGQSNDDLLQVTPACVKWTEVIRASPLPNGSLIPHWSCRSVTPVKIMVFS